MGRGDGGLVRLQRAAGRGVAQGDGVVGVAQAVAGRVVQDRPAAHRHAAGVVAAAGAAIQPDGPSGDIHTAAAGDEVANRQRAANALQRERVGAFRDGAAGRSADTFNRAGRRQGNGLVKGPRR